MMYSTFRASKSQISCEVLWLTQSKCVSSTKRRLVPFEQSTTFASYIWLVCFLCRCNLKQVCRDRRMYRGRRFHWSENGYADNLLYLTFSHKVFSIVTTLTRNHNGCDGLLVERYARKLDLVSSDMVRFNLDVLRQFKSPSRNFSWLLDARL